MKPKATILLLLLSLGAARLLAAPNEASLLEAAGLHGGFVVCTSCDDPGLLAALRRSEAFVVQGLDTNPARAAAARQSLQSAGISGPVSTRVWDGRVLPYVENLVNLLVVPDSGARPTNEEIARILAPRGVALVRGALPSVPKTWKSSPAPGLDGWTKLVKPVPPEIDEWTHYLHDADNNALARDTVVGPPRHVQWLAGPQWGRHHHAEKGGNPAVRAVVSSGGRLFMLADQAKTSNRDIPPEWTVMARDAFSGVLLWERPTGIPDYEIDFPGIWRRLLVDDERLYTTVGTEGALQAFDAVTGKPVVAYNGTAGLDEVIKADGRLLALLKTDELLALRTEDGKQLWRWQPGADEEVSPLTLAAADGKVFMKTNRDLYCLSAESGQTLWQRELPGATRDEVHRWQKAIHYPGKLLVSEGVVLCSYGAASPADLEGWAKDGTPQYAAAGAHRLVTQYGGRLGAFSADDGKQLWETVYLPQLANGPGEVYIRDGLVWSGPFFDKPRNLLTGEIEMVRSVTGKLWTDGHHARCYPAKATSNYIITAKRGIEMIDLVGDNHSRNNWVRGTCQVGITPCNGLLYAPPHSCGCYQGAKLIGFWALAPQRPAPAAELEPGHRLEKGPAYSMIEPATLPVSGDGWWTYRGNNERGAATVDHVPADLKTAWTVSLGGKLTATTVAAGKVFVAQVDAHTVHALDMKTGSRLWSFVAGGRVDSPPTVVDNLAWFGSRDGYVYCLRASDGQMVWRFLAAAQPRSTIAFGQPESVWPVHGSVLFHQGIVYAAAGRSSYLDGGIQLYGLDPLSGQVVCSNLVTSQHVGAMEPPEDAAELAVRDSQNWRDYKSSLAPDQSDSFAMQGVTSDILVADHDSVYMRRMRFDTDLVPQKTTRSHLYSTSSLLDGWEHDRTYQILGTGNFYGTPVAYPWILSREIQVPFGLMLAFDKDTVWGVHHLNGEKPRRKGKGGQTAPPSKGNPVFAVTRPDPAAASSALPDFQTRASSPTTGWTANAGLRTRSMVKAGDLLFLGGMPADHFGDPALFVAGKGEEGALVQVISCKDGNTVGTISLDSPPVWDGMAAAKNCLFVSCEDGRVMCLAKDD